MNGELPTHWRTRGRQIAPAQRAPTGTGTRTATRHRTASAAGGGGLGTSPEAEQMEYPSRAPAPRPRLWVASDYLDPGRDYRRPVPAQAPIGSSFLPLLGAVLVGLRMVVKAIGRLGR
jgi:hypothetical protein